MKSIDLIEEKYQQAAQAIREADGLLIAAGAGMGVDSGLPDFRGKDGFWKAYPGLGKANIAFQEIASPEAFSTMPTRVWGFYGHRLNLYRETVPHEGFRILREMGAKLQQGAFVYTSNVDGQFQQAGFSESRLCEIHGSLHYLQCLNNCDQSWAADEFVPEVDQEQCRLTSPLPRCPRCHELARPQIMMFNDWRFITDRVERQQRQFDAWKTQVKNPVTIEIGAGTNIPSIRRFAELSGNGFLIRINPNDADLSWVHGRQGVALQVGALEALREIAIRLQGG
jgi:NAD-dependent SIR2 family protein deacetylase